MSSDPWARLAGGTAGDFKRVAIRLLYKMFRRQDRNSAQQWFNDFEKVVLELGWKGILRPDGSRKLGKACEYGGVRVLLLVLCEHFLAAHRCMQFTNVLWIGWTADPTIRNGCCVHARTANTPMRRRSKAAKVRRAKFLVSLEVTYQSHHRVQLSWASGETYMANSSPTKSRRWRRSDKLSLRPRTASAAGHPQTARELPAPLAVAPATLPKLLEQRLNRPPGPFPWPRTATTTGEKTRTATTAVAATSPTTRVSWRATRAASSWRFYPYPRPRLGPWRFPPCLVSPRPTAPTTSRSAPSSTTGRASAPSRRLTRGSPRKTASQPCCTRT